MQIGTRVKALRYNEGTGGTELEPAEVVGVESDKRFTTVRYASDGVRRRMLAEYVSRVRSCRECGADLDPFGVCADVECPSVVAA